jgi:rSAM/selenodomain-associated transferase 1
MTANPFRRWPADAWLIVLARWPEPGVGKTRLAAALGRDRAHDLQQAFLDDSLGWASLSPNLLIAFTPASAAGGFRRRAPNARLRVQPAGDLGRRIHQAFVDAFGLGAGRAVIIGSDSPNLPGSIVDACMGGLSRADAVIAPSTDGGFCALGLKRAHPQLFDPVHWGSSVVLEQITRNARRLGLNLRTTVPWYDVDDLAGLTRLRADLSSDGQFASRTAAKLAQIDLHQGSPRRK